ncbi:anti-virulence regulator CigR family protein [Alcaligenes sp. WGS1538]|uniref:anti-virulence regulator CigR family protein n=1 Tax=Alcaligenes sp. WGS1538 TaxID=3366811 RepID=UPI00372D82FC
MLFDNGLLPVSMTPWMADDGLTAFGLVLFYRFFIKNICTGQSWTSYGPASAGSLSGMYPIDANLIPFRGRHYDYFDDHRDSRGRLQGQAATGDLVYAGITAALAREYAVDYGLGGYSALPPGIRMNLARGKPLPPGIAKRAVPGSLLGRLPSYPGYEWRIAGTDLILISLSTALIADVLYDVFD